MAKQAYKLTEAACEKAKPSDARRELADGGGLFLIVQTSGGKSWALRYRRDGRTRKLTLGGYPAVDLKTARGLSRKALNAVAEGADPAAQKAQRRRATMDRETDFASAAAAFLAQCLTRKGVRPRPKTLAQLSLLLGMRDEGDGWAPVKGGLADRWRTKKVYEIGRGDVAAAVDADLARGVPVLASRRRAVLSWFLSWCLRRDLITTNPAKAVEAPTAASRRSRVLTDSEIAIFWRACGMEGTYGALWRFLLLTGCRREEARGARWNEIDTEAGLWRIPAERVKNSRSLTLPLSRAALEILAARPRIGSQGFVFTHSGENAISGMSRAVARLARNFLALAREADPKAAPEPFTLHDLRRSAATGMARQGISIPVIEKILNHTSGTFAGIVGVYQHHDFLPEMRAAADTWAAHIEALASGSTATALPMRRRSNDG